MLIYVLAYAVSLICSRMALYELSGFLLIITAIFLFCKEWTRVGRMLNLRGLFALSFVGGEGLSALKLSKLQVDWSMKTWLAFFLVFVCFWYAFSWENGHRKKRKKENLALVEDREKKWVIGIILVTAFSLLGFIVEAVVLGFIPFFLVGVPHAYSIFHISGVHYFTVSCVLVPAMGMLYFFDHPKKYQLSVVLCMGIALCIPILCVSRSQFIFAIMAAIFVVVIKKKSGHSRVMLVGFLILLPIYIILTIARSHNVAYLNSIFEMKRSWPIFISQPYIYIANNYDNFDVLVKSLPAHSYGIRMLFPVWGLTGLKFLCPWLVHFPLYVNKPELTTLTIIYDAYYDFGLLGVMLFGAVLGCFTSFIEGRVRDNQNPISILFYVQLMLYMGLSFFTTWFSNPATWFYFIVTAILYQFMKVKKRGESNDIRKDETVSQ